MEELYKFMNQSNATLDLKVGNELATEEGEPAEVLLWLTLRLDSICTVHKAPLFLDLLPLVHVKAILHCICLLSDCCRVQTARNWVATTCELTSAGGRC